MIYFEIVITILLGFVFDNIQENNISNNKRKSIYIIVCIILFWVIAALRNIHWVASLHLDAEGYASVFRYNLNVSWFDMIRNISTRYIYHSGDSDIGYALLNKFVGLVTDDYNIFSLIADSLFFIPLGLMLYKYTTKVRHILFAFMLYIALVQVHMISGARQMLALGIDIIAVMYAIENKKVKSIVFIILGVTLHFSSLLTLIPVIMIFIDLKPRILKRIHIVSFLMFPIFLIFPNQIIRFMGNAIGLEKYAQYGANAIQGGANTFIILMELISIFCYFAFDITFLSDNVNIRKFYTMVPLFTIFAPLIHSNGSMIRICMYFFIYLMVILPYGLDHLFTERSHKYAYLLTVGALTFLIIKGGTMNYHFMWQSF